MCDAFEENRSCPCFMNRKLGLVQGVRLEVSVALLHYQRAFDLSLLTSVANRSFALFDRWDRLGQGPQPVLPLKGSLLLQPFCAPLASGSCD